MIIFDTDLKSEFHVGTSALDFSAVFNESKIHLYKLKTLTVAKQTFPSLIVAVEAIPLVCISANLTVGVGNITGFIILQTFPANFYSLGHFWFILKQ